jgi:hypothetical protein
MAQSSPTIYKGNDAALWFAGSTTVGGGIGSLSAHGNFAVSDFTLTLAKGTVEQELVGEIANYSLAGALTAEGSLTGCKMYNTGLGVMLGCLINGYNFTVSGNCGANSLHFFLRSCQVTGFDFTLGTAEDITEGSVDFTVLYPYKISTSRIGTYTVIADSIWP